MMDTGTTGGFKAGCGLSEMVDALDELACISNWVSFVFEVIMRHSILEASDTSQ
jgi:hypothetical protein